MMEFSDAIGITASFPIPNSTLCCLDPLLLRTQQLSVNSMAQLMSLPKECVHHLCEGRLGRKDCAGWEESSLQS